MPDRPPLPATSLPPAAELHGPGSFCVPRAAIEALLAARATAYDICTYLTLARFTDASGVYATASLSAMHRYTGANKTREGPLARSLARLRTITAPVVSVAGSPASGNPRLAIVYDRAGWQAVTGEVLADPARRGDVRHVLPHFGEPLADRVWIGNNLVTGVPGYSRPLKAVKDAGDVAARVLLALYAGHAMDAWGGCDPTTTVCRLYQPAARPPATTVAEVHLGAGSVMTAWQPLGISACDPMLRAGPWASWQEHTAAGGPLFTALRLLESLGLVYEVALAVNRRYSATRMPADIEPLYELAARLPPGYDGRSEAGMQRAIATTLDELGHVLDPEPAGGHRVIAPDGQPHQVLGVYRLRFRVSNPKNAGVKGAWARIHNGTVDARQRIAQIRSSAGLQPL